jgi:DNA-binding Xre family transcriptional regulator
MIDYSGLTRKLKEQKITRTDLCSLIGLSSRTIAKIGKGEALSGNTLRRIADYLGCDPAQLYREVSDNPILQTLRDEKEGGISGGLYHELQVRMTYNSNHMEGSRLTEEQTRLIFETNTAPAGDGVPVDDILETVHHFRAIDFIIDHAEDDLSEEIIKHLHYLLKHDTKDSTLSWFAVGDYKKRPNMVGGHETARPEEVPERMKGLLAHYHKIGRERPVTLNDIIAFHAELEYIHPFQDGNGRVGRLVALKECLRYRIVPFLIENDKKMYYYRGLANWHQEKGWLIDTCLDGQDTFRALMDALGVPDS